MSDRVLPWQASDEAFDRLEPQLKINKYELDEELVNQPDFFNKIGQRYAEAISYRDEAKSDRERVRAMLDREFRDEAGDKKLTEAALNNMIIGHPSYEKATLAMAAWEDRVNKWRALLDGVKARGYVLSDLVTLYNTGYWADSAGGKDRAAARENVAREVKEEMSQMRRSKRQRLPDEE